jgi:S-DNA-T family DNA segregation ATPase FtsK/SpoIIIE
MKKKKLKNKKVVERGRGRLARYFALPDEVKRVILAVVIFLIAVIITLSFFDSDLAGTGGRFISKSFEFLFGSARIVFPFFLALLGFAFFKLKYKNKWPILLAILLLLLGTAGIFEGLNLNGEEGQGGGWVGYLISWPLLKLFELLVTRIIFAALIVIGVVILWQFLYKRPKSSLVSFEKSEKAAEAKPPLLKRIFGPKFKVQSLEPLPAPLPDLKPPPEPMKKAAEQKPQYSKNQKDYRFPPLDLFESDKGVPSAGDIRINSAIIKRTLQNFGIQVEMSEVNIGPTVTQYTFKPAEGVKLSKITTLSNDLALALAAHPIRIEAPIPGKPLVGIEVPDKIRTLVRLRNLIEHHNFQNAASNLILVLGRDVAGYPVFADLARMPHLLVAGSTGTGKTICLNSLILSLLYQNSPEILQLILIDPKRVEFSVYNDLPHLLTPVIYDAQKSVNVLKWLIEEMERRFNVLSQESTRDITSYNEKMVSQGLDPMPYIVLIIDELADLMAARGRDMEAGIVRLAQLARAVGIHLIVATQRPSVEVITGLIKANITSRITFQVASQIDSRTVLDTAGAEKLLGLGDLLFISADISKPKRIQGAFVSDKEVKKVTKYIKAETPPQPAHEDLPGSDKGLERLDRVLEESGSTDFWGGEDDPLFEEAKKVVIEAKKASASLLQRRLRVGYARAARLIDMLEEKGIVGPGEGAKPREIFIGNESEPDEKDWQKV